MLNIVTIRKQKTNRPVSVTFSVGPPLPPSYALKIPDEHTAIMMDQSLSPYIKGRLRKKYYEPPLPPPEILQVHVVVE